MALNKHITIGVPSYNRPNWLCKTLEQFLNLNDNRIIEIIVVDQTKWENIENEYQLRLTDLCSSSKIKYLFEDLPSLPHARNRIIKESNGEIIIWVDDDVLINKNFIDYHINAYANSNVVACAGQVYQRLEKIDENDINFTNFLNFSYPAHFEIDDMRPFHGPLVGCNHSTLKKSLIKVNGVDENFGGSGYYSDADLGDRLRIEFGMDSIIFSKKASIIHIRSKTGGCKIDGNKRSEKDNLWPFVFYYYRYRFGGRHTLTGLFEILRVGPLRKSKLKSFAFVSSLLTCINLFFILNREKCGVKNVISILKINK